MPINRPKLNFWLKIALCGLLLVAPRAFADTIVSNTTTDQINGDAYSNSQSGTPFLPTVCQNFIAFPASSPLQPTNLRILGGFVSATSSYQSDRFAWRIYDRPCVRNGSTTAVLGGTLIASTSADSPGASKESGGTAWNLPIVNAGLIFAGVPYSLIQGEKSGAANALDFQAYYSVANNVGYPTTATSSAFVCSQSSPCQSGDPTATWGQSFVNGGGVAPVPNGNLSFVLTGGTPAPTIAFLIPQNNASTSDFSRWQVHLENLVQNTTYSVSVAYTLTPISSGGLTDTLTFNSGGGGAPQNIYIPKSAPLAYAISNSNWVATSTLISSGTSLATSTAVFTIFAQSFNFSSSTQTALPTGTSTLTATCDPNSGFVNNSLCNIFVFLFVPSQDALNNFSLLKTSYQNKPPFGYFTSIETSLSGLQNGTSSIVLMSSSTFVAFNAEFQPLRDGLSWLFWFIFAWWAFHRLRKIEL
jgi:hypothetical protein